ncbi:MAG: hypothetical protein E7492_02725 [Ruminococcaceae bacterium]|nr:hypothetical protein [Oscillospiraceae bacterium]
MDNKTMVLLKKYLIVIIGQIIIGIGCAFMVTSGQGNDPMGVMVSGFSQMFDIPFGTMTNIISFIIFAVLLVVYRKRLTLTTLITVFVIGWTIDPVNKLLAVINASEMVVKFAYPLIGCIIISIGVAFYLCIDFGASITDNVILMIADLTGKSYAVGCYSLYAVYTLIGVITGGVWGYATVLGLLLNGKIIDILIPVFSKSVAVWANK